MRDNSTIKIYKNDGKFKVNIICDQNDKVVASGNRRGYAKLTFLYWKLSLILDNQYLSFIYKSLGQHRFRICEVGKKHLSGPIILHSEGYHNEADCQTGLNATLKAVKAGRVALDFSEDSNIWDLKALIADPTLGIVQT